MIDYKYKYLKYKEKYNILKANIDKMEGGSNTVRTKFILDKTTIIEYKYDSSGSGSLVLIKDGISIRISVGDKIGFRLLSESTLSASTLTTFTINSIKIIKENNMLTCIGKGNDKLNIPYKIGNIDPKKIKYIDLKDSERIIIFHTKHKI